MIGGLEAEGDDARSGAGDGALGLQQNVRSAVHGVRSFWNTPVKLFCIM